MASPRSRSTPANREALRGCFDLSARGLAGIYATQVTGTSPKLTGSLRATVRHALSELGTRHEDDVPAQADRLVA